jgi:DnaJ family protein B protein 12
MPSRSSHSAFGHGGHGGGFQGDLNPEDLFNMFFGGGGGMRGNGFGGANGEQQSLLDSTLD